MTDPSQYFRGRTVQEQMNEVIGYVDVRSAEVATDAIAADVAQVHQDMLDADADAAAAAASAAAAAGTLANAVKKTGEASQTVEGDMVLSTGGLVVTTGDLGVAGDATVGGDLAVTGDVTGGTVTVPTPVNNTDAASKKYVDDADALNVQLAGSQAITGTKTVPLEATGTFSNQIASSNKVKNELDNYSPMVRDTGNKTIAGIKTFSSQVVVANGANAARYMSVDTTGAAAMRTWMAYNHTDTTDANAKAWINVQVESSGRTIVTLNCKNADNTTKTVVLLEGDL